MQKENKTTAVRIDAETVKKVREEKKLTGVPVGKFFELAAIEKLKKKV